MRILCIAHSDMALADHIIDWLENKHYALFYCRPFQGELLPSIEEFDWLILTGGMHSLLEKERYPFLLDEIRLVEKAIANGKRVLGFCLGAQVIGESYGQKTELSPHREIGIFPVELTPEGRSDPIFQGLPTSFDVAHWHRCMPGVTETAKILATSPGCPRQIIRYSPTIYGFQCHIDVSFKTTQKAFSLVDEEVPPGPYIQTKEQFLQGNFSAIENTLLTILDNLVALE